MTRGIQLLLFAGSVMCLGACTAQPAAELPSSGQPPVRGFIAGQAPRKPDYSAFAQGVQVTGQGQAYLLLSGVRAVPADPGSEPAGLDILERKGPFVLYRDQTPTSPSAGPMILQPSSASGLSLTTFAVVLNPRTGNAGVVLGTIAAKLADPSQADAVAKLHGVTVTSRFDHLGLVFFMAAQGQDIAAAVVALRSDPRVTSADPEILENPKVPY